MEIKSVKNLVWANEGKTKFDAQVDFAEIGTVPYTASPDSPSEYGQEIWTKGIRGDYGLIEAFVPVTTEPEVVIVPSVTLWGRMTIEEAAAVESVMSGQPFRTRQIFMTAPTFRSDHELWPLLEEIAVQLFGAERAAELLAQPEGHVS